MVRCGGGGVQGTVVIGAVVGSGKFLVVAVAAYRSVVTIGFHLVIVVGLVGAIGDPFVTDCLAGSVKAAIRKEHGAFVRSGIVNTVIDVIVVRGGN